MTFHLVCLLSLYLFHSLAIACEVKMGYRTSERLPNIEKPPSNEGLYKELYSTALKEIDCTLKIIRAPKKRVMKMLSEGDVDFYPGLGRSEEREKYLYFMKNGLVGRPVIVTKNDIPPIASLDALKNLVMIRSHGANKVFTQNHKYIRYVNDLSVSQAIKALDTGKADFFQYDVGAVEYYLSRKPKPNMRIHDNLFTETPFLLGFSKRSRHAIPANRRLSKMLQFEQSLITLTKTKVTSKIVSKYYNYTD